MADVNAIQLKLNYKSDINITRKSDDYHNENSCDKFCYYKIKFSFSTKTRYLTSRFPDSKWMIKTYFPDIFSS